MNTQKGLTVPVVTSESSFELPVDVFINDTAAGTQSVKTNKIAKIISAFFTNKSSFITLYSY